MKRTLSIFAFLVCCISGFSSTFPNPFTTNRAGVLIPGVNTFANVGGNGGGLTNLNGNSIASPLVVSSSSAAFPNGAIIVASNTVGNSGVFTAGYNAGYAYVALGDIFKISNGASIYIIDSQPTIEMDVPFGIIQLGDIEQLNFGTRIQIDTSGQTFEFINGTVSLQTNTASLVTLTNPVTSGVRWTNTTTSRGFLTLNGTHTEAVGGAPSMCITNLSNGEWSNQTNSLSLVGVLSWRTELVVGPNEIIIVTNKSTGAGASSTLNASWFRNSN